MEEKGKQQTMTALGSGQGGKVRVLFSNLETVGGSLTMVFGDVGGVERYTFHDGREYEVPKALMEHINTNCGQPLYKVNPAVNREDLDQFDPEAPAYIKAGVRPRFRMTLVGPAAGETPALRAAAG